MEQPRAPHVMHQMHTFCRVSGSAGRRVLWFLDIRVSINRGPNVAQSIVCINCWDPKIPNSVEHHKREIDDEGCWFWRAGFS